MSARSQQSGSNGGGGSWFDRMVQRAGQRMAAGRDSRRGFLGKVGAGLAAAGAVGVVGSTDEAHAQGCVLPTGCYGTVDVNVCYTPWVVTTAESGVTGVFLRKGPWFDAEVVTQTDGTPVMIPVGGTFGRCSTRSGSVSGGCPDPGPRGNLGGFLWGYWVGYHRQGWIPYSVSGVTYATPESNYGPTLCGPAGFDFDCRLGSQHPKTDCTNTCGGADVGSPTCSVTHRPVVAYATDPSDERFYLRYAANSTTFFWLVPGDQVKRWGYKSAGSYTWSCVEVICAKYAPNGCRGWIRSDALGADNGGTTACFPQIVTCPSGS